MEGRWRGAYFCIAEILCTFINNNKITSLSVKIKNISFVVLSFDTHSILPTGSYDHSNAM
jgi:hypothetical protein